jgi:hypothetical protein
MLEVFTDLFFAANYVVFSKELAVTSVDRLGSYTGYFWCAMNNNWNMSGDAELLICFVQYVVDELACRWAL